MNRAGLFSFSMSPSGAEEQLGYDEKAQASEANKKAGLRNSLKDADANVIA